VPFGGAPQRQGRLQHVPLDDQVASASVAELGRVEDRPDRLGALHDLQELLEGTMSSSRVAEVTMPR